MTTELQKAAAPVVSEEQKRSKIWQHPERDMLHALLRRGKSASWISLWLEERYPIEDEDGEPDPDATKHKRWQLTPATIERYRKRFMPETVPGVDIASEELEDLIGREAPRPRRHEIDLMEIGIRVAEKNLVRALEQDEEMGMLQPTTLNAHQAFMNANKETIEIKGKLGEPGYEFVAEKQEITQHSSNLSVSLHGRVDPKTGKVIASDPERMEIARELMQRTPRESLAMVGEMKAEAERRQVGKPDVDGRATEVPSDAELDGGEESQPARP